MQMPLVRVTPVNQFFHQNCFDKLALDNANATRASDYSNERFHQNRIGNLNLNMRINAARVSDSSVKSKCLH